MNPGEFADDRNGSVAEIVPETRRLAASGNKQTFLVSSKVKTKSGISVNLPDGLFIPIFVE